MTKIVENRSREQLLLENEKLRRQLEEANETLRAIRSGEVDALVVYTEKGEQVFTQRRRGDLPHNNRGDERRRSITLGG